MKAGGGREKGNSFERRVAKTTVLAFSSFGIEQKDCYRTPSSGGHKYAKQEDPGDLVISKRLRKFFPFHIECKHYRKVELFTLWISENRIKKTWKLFAWIRQAKAASLKTKLLPVVVFKSNGNMPIMCLFPNNKHTEPPLRVLRFTFEGDTWYCSTYKSFLMKHKANAEKKNANHN